MAGSNEVNESKVIPLHCSINRRPYSFPLDFLWISVAIVGWEHGLM